MQLLKFDFSKKSYEREKSENWRVQLNQNCAGENQDIFPENFPAFFMNAKKSHGTRGEKIGINVRNVDLEAVV